MKMAFEKVEQVMEGVWVTDVQASDIKGLASRTATSGLKSIIAVSGAHYDQAGGLLTVSPSAIDVLSIGSSDTALLIEQSASVSKSSVNDQAKQTKPSVDTALPLKGHYGDFLEACLEEGLPRELVRLVSDILNEMRGAIQFDLAEGKARKWTANPNFVAITIQNRNKQLLVSVKGDHRRMSYKTIKPVMGRGIAYSEFHLNSYGQFDEALDAIQKSAGV